MDTTAHWAIPKPEADRSDIPDGANQIGDFAEYLDSNPHGRVAMAQQGTLAARPVSTVGVPGKRDRRYLVVGDPDPAQNGIEYIDTGTSWIAVAATIPPGSIDTAELADNAVTQPKMADDSVGASEIIADSVGASELAPGAVTAAEVANALKPSAGAGAGTEALRALGTSAGLAAAGSHAAQHARTGADPLDLTTYHIADVYANRPAAAAALNGVRFFATDKMMEWQCVAAAWVLVAALAPEVSALPGAPIDGQRCTYAPAGENVRWALQYDASDGYWYFVGGAPIHKVVVTAENAPTGAAYGNPTTVGPQVPIALAGDYAIGWGVHMTPSAAGLIAQAVPDGAGYVAADNEAVRHEGSSTQDEDTISRFHNFTGLTAAGTLTLKYKSSGANTSVSRRWMRVVPIRVQ